MSDEKPTRQFACSYHHDGSEWGVMLHAYDWADAEARVKKLGYLRLDGEVVGIVPAMKTGWLVKLLCWLRNKWQHPPEERSG
jgi:hypothetical protein